MTDYGKPADPFDRAMMANPPAAKPGAHHVGPYRFTEDELDELLAAVWQVLDDMGIDGQSCCLAAKISLANGLLPFIRGNPDLALDYAPKDGK